MHQIRDLAIVLGFLTAASAGPARAQEAPARTPEQVGQRLDQALEKFQKPRLKAKGGLFGGAPANRPETVTYEVLPIRPYRSKDITFTPRESTPPSVTVTPILPREETFEKDPANVDVRVQFALDSASIRPQDYPLLQKVIEFGRKHPDVPLQINGHTDKATGGYDHNLRLSQERATSVRDYLVDVGGLDPGLLTGHGFGPNNPLFPENNRANIERNRRVEFRLER